MATADDFSWPVSPAVWSPRSLPQLLLLYFPPLSPVRLPEGNWWRSTQAPDPRFSLGRGRGFVWSWLPLSKGSLSQLTNRRRLFPETVLCPFYPCPLSFMLPMMSNTVKHVKREIFPYSSVESKSQKCLLWHTQPVQKKIIEHTETCVKSPQDKHDRSYAYIPLLYKIMLI